jgi:hypothetical protein
MQIMNKEELDEQIGKLSRQESEKKEILEEGLIRYKRQMMPGEIAKRFLKKGVMKVRSFLPHFSSMSNRKHF